MGRRHRRVEGRVDTRAAQPADSAHSASWAPSSDASVVRANGAGTPVQAPVFANGFAAIEAEFVVQLAKDAPANVAEWTTETARRFVKAMFIGIEIASSPLSQHQRLRPGRRRERLRQQRRTAARTRNPGLADASLDTDALRNANRRRGRRTRKCRGRERWTACRARVRPALQCPARPPLRAGDFVSTGAVTGVHSIAAGRSAEVDLHRFGTLRCQTVPMTPVAQN